MHFIFVFIMFLFVFDANAQKKHSHKFSVSIDSICSLHNIDDLSDTIPIFVTKVADKVVQKLQNNFNITYYPNYKSKDIINTDFGIKLIASYDYEIRMYSLRIIFIDNYDKSIISSVETLKKDIFINESLLNKSIYEILDFYFYRYLVDVEYLNNNNDFTLKDTKNIISIESCVSNKKNKKIANNVLKIANNVLKKEELAKNEDGKSINNFNYIPNYRYKNKRDSKIKCSFILKENKDTFILEVLYKSDDVSYNFQEMYSEKNIELSKKRILDKNYIEMSTKISKLFSKLIILFF